MRPRIGAGPPSRIGCGWSNGRGVSIRRLPDHLVNQIAAGEVVERPASALKELVENALDAGAGRITVTLTDGGIAGVEVVDDGCGMTPDELRLAVQRHATSKLPDDAIEQVRTMGFRGEALPSIASVAHLALTSRSADGTGWTLVVDNGAVTADRPAAGARGTRVAVTGLFSRVPARAKFLRTARAEGAACLTEVRRLALSRPDVAFTVQGDGRTRLSAPADQDLDARVAALTDAGLRDAQVQVALERDGVALAGLASLPTFTRGVADHQYLFVNGRPVRDRLLTGAIRGAYAERVMRGRHPVVALFLTVPLDQVDVNVHPAKTEVRFRYAAAIRSLVVGGLRAALDGAGHRAAGRPAHRQGWTVPMPMPMARRDEDTVNESLADWLPAARPEPATQPPPATADHPLGVARAQVARTYIVSEAADGLVLVDQHAAHERLVLEALRSAAAGRDVAAQTLLQAEVVELDEGACDRMVEAADTLSRLGLVLERFRTGRGAGARVARRARNHRRACPGDRRGGRARRV